MSKPTCLRPPSAALPLLWLCAAALPRRAAACADGSYTFGGTCTACPPGAALVAETGVCRPSATLTAGPTDTAFYLSGSSAEGVTAFPGAPTVGYSAGVFGAAAGGLSFASSASFLSMSPATGSALLASLPTGNSPFTMSAWYKCATGSAMTPLSWGAPSVGGASSVALAAGATLFGNVGYRAGTVLRPPTLAWPYGVATDAVGNIYFVSALNPCTVQVMSRSGVISPIWYFCSGATSMQVTLSGDPVWFAGGNQLTKLLPDGTLSVINIVAAPGEGGFTFFPQNFAIDSQGTIYASDTVSKGIRKFSASGTNTWIPGFTNPQAVAVCLSTNVVYVADGTVVRMIQNDVVTVFASGFTNGIGGIAADASAQVYVAVFSAAAVNADIQKFSSTGQLIATFGSVGANANYVAIDAQYNIIVSVLYSGIKVIPQSTVLSACDSSWHHLALTHGEGSPSVTKTYLDGALIATSQQTYAIPSDGSASLAVNQNAATGISSGATEEVRVYKRALSAAEVLALSQPPLQSLANTVPSPPLPVLQASAYTFSCAAGSVGAASTLSKSPADNSWAWLGGSPSSCATCEAGSWAPQGTTACTICPPGSYSLAGAASCALCPAGRYGASAGLASALCSGACPGCAAGTAVPPTPTLAAISGFSCASGGTRAAPPSLGLLLWPAAHPNNPQKVDLIVAPQSQCDLLTPGGACNMAPANSVVGADGKVLYAIGTAAALHLEAAEPLECAAVYASPSPSPSAPATASASPSASAIPSLSVSASPSATVSATQSQSPSASAAPPILRFTAVGTSSWTVPLGVTAVDVLIVAGGGGGAAGDLSAGGGGAGGFICLTAVPVTPGQALSVTVGAGGPGSLDQCPSPAGGNGGNSVFASYTAIGGGGGGGTCTSNSLFVGSGGSGGGVNHIGGSPGSGTAGQGFAGSGQSYNDNNSVWSGAGGGGASEPGHGGTYAGGGAGGNGASCTPFGSAFFAGGGGGSAASSNGYAIPPGAGGLGGGGSASAWHAVNSWAYTGADQTPQTAGTNGLPNTGGGGGGGGGFASGGDGGSGIVMVRAHI